MSVDNSATATMDPQQGAQAYNDAASVLGGSTAGQFQQSADQVQQQQDPIPDAPLNGRSGASPQLQAPPPKKSVLADIAHAIGDVLGGPKTAQRVNPQTGMIENVPLSTGQRVGNMVGAAVRGAAAGAAERGPGAAGRAALAGVREQQQFQQQQTDNTLAQSKNTQDVLRTKASTALMNQQLAEAGLRSAREGTAIDDATAQKFDQMQEIVASNPGNAKIGHFNSFADMVSNHPELVKSGINIPQLQAQGLLRAIVTTENGKSTGIDIYRVSPEWEKQRYDKDIVVRQANGLDGNGDPIYNTSVIPANTLPNGTALTLLGATSKNEMDAVEKSIQLKNQATQQKNTQAVQKSEIAKNYAEANAATANAGSKNDELAVAYDPDYKNPDGSLGGNVVMPKGQARMNKLQHYKADPSTINATVGGFNDVQNKINDLANVTLDPRQNQAIQPEIAAAMLQHGKGIELGISGTKIDTSMINESLYKEDVRNANEATRNYVAAMGAAHEAMTQLPRLQTFGKSSRMTQQQMEAAQNMLPQPGDDPDMAQRKMTTLQTTLDPLRKQLPHMQGAEIIPTWKETGIKPMQLTMQKPKSIQPGQLTGAGAIYNPR